MEIRGRSSLPRSAWQRKGSTLCVASGALLVLGFTSPSVYDARGGIQAQSASFAVALFMECGDVTPLLFFLFGVAAGVKEKTGKTKKNTETKAVLHHRTP